MGSRVTASFSILDCDSVFDAVRLISECLYVIRKGKIISKTIPARREVYSQNTIFPVDFKLKKDPKKNSQGDQ